VKLGAENKKAAYFLGVLLVVLGYVFYSSVLSGPSSPDASTSSHVTAPVVPSDADDAQASRAQIAARARDEFLPKLHDQRNAKPLDPTTVDPTLHIELLAKLNEVPPAGSGRDLFSLTKPAPVLKGPEAIVIPKAIPIGPPVIPKKVDSGPPPPPPPPPINLKYYGIVTTLTNGKKTAFFMDGDDILLETEGVTFKGRYRLVRIGVNSAVVEDLQYKHEQTLPLTEDAQG
jgi:hypothetical protein